VPKYQFLTVINVFIGPNCDEFLEHFSDFCNRTIQPVALGRNVIDNVCGDKYRSYDHSEKEMKVK
jgi:hypothetical protein